jgi:hypothetical protein
VRQEHSLSLTATEQTFAPIRRRAQRRGGRGRRAAREQARRAKRQARDAALRDLEQQQREDLS